MNYKFTKTIKDNKVSIVIIMVLWVLLTIVLVAPVAYSIVESTVNGSFDLAVFIEKIFPAITSFSTIGVVFGTAYIGTFLITLAYFTLIYFYI